MKQLAIKGHPTRGNEIGEIFKMFGCACVFDCRSYLHYYYLNNNNSMSWFKDGDYKCSTASKLFKIFTLEQFLEKFPYKVGDKVIYNGEPMEITKMVWEEQTRTVAYKLNNKIYCNVIKELQPYLNL